MPKMNNRGVGLPTVLQYTHICLKLKGLRIKEFQGFSSFHAEQDGRASVPARNILLAMI